MAVILSIDAGTTGVRCLAVDTAGVPVAWSYREFPQYFPRPGLVEHDAVEIWEAVCTTMAEAAHAADAAGHRAVAVGITNQRETVVVWDRRTGSPLHRAIVWQDRRTARRCEQLDEAGLLPEVRRRTGLVLDPYFSGTKLAWLFTEGGLTADAHTAAGTVDSWLVWQLTGGAVHATDPSNASRTMLFDLGELAWSDHLCDAIGVPGHVLPEVRPSSGSFGSTAPGLPVPAGIPVCGIAGDQQAALFGQLCTSPGMAKNTYGTGSFVLANVGATCPDPVDGLLTTVAWSLDGTGGVHTDYALEGAVFVTGAAVQWLRDGLGLIDHATDLEPLAARCDDTDGVVLVPAFTGLGSPWWDPWARGALVGLTRGSGAPQLARAVIEAMVHQTRDVVDAMAAAGTPLHSLRVDGGAAAMDLLVQMQADLLGVPVVRPALTETTALGAAYLAGLGAGVWSSTDELAATWQAELTAEPGIDRADADARHDRWHRGVDRARGWLAETG